MTIEKLLAEAISNQTEVFASMADRMEKLEKAAATVQTAPQLHGEGGLFSTPGLEREVVTAHMRPHGIAAVLPLLPTVDEDPRFPSITGFQSDGADEPASACLDAPAGYMKGANLTARLGLTRRDTNTIDIGKVMLRVNRGDFTDLVLYGRVLGENLAPSSVVDSNDMLRVLTKAEMVTAAVGAERKLSQDMWQGTIAAGTFPGFDVQIATGQMDADTSTLAPALDSLILDFAGTLITATSLDIVEYMSAMEFDLRTRSISMGLDPTTWVICMRDELWFELSATWPALYFTNRGGDKVRVDGSNIINARDAMRNGRYIDINGNRYPVVTDTGIYEKNNINTAGIPAAQFQGNIYFVPMTITGGFPVAYRQYLDFSKTQEDAALLNNMQTFWSDGGIYTWAIENAKWCYKLALRTEQRVILRTPHLAGKIQDVRYSPINHIREPYPDSAYFADGGVSTRAISYGNAVWS